MGQNVPAIFSAESIRAILDGSKTATRRLVKPQPPPDSYFTERGGLPVGYYQTPAKPSSAAWVATGSVALLRAAGGPLTVTPYARVGDVLWVREAFAFHRDLDDMKPSEVDPWLTWYKADLQPDDSKPADAGRWRSPLHMPFWAARLHLDVTRVACERLHAITDAGAVAEGYRSRRQFRAAWDGLNAHRAPWDTNPLVWAVTFRRVPDEG